MQRVDIQTTSWSDYTILDSGEGRKLERIGGILLDRPDPQVLWHKKYPELWFDAQAQFAWADKGERWKLSKGTPDVWQMKRGALVLELACKGFKHVGVFPEHAWQWDELTTLGATHQGLRMLNLFGYTGAASVAAAQAGIQVTHVDASKTTIETVKKNAELSGLTNDAIRVICEDAVRYVKRLIQRGETFEVIIMDPPAFGRGPKGEVWKIEESLAELVALIPQLLSKNAQLVFLNGYAAGYSARTFGELLQEVFPEGDISYGEITISDTQRYLTTGIYSAWRRV